MSDYLNTLVARTMRLEPVVQPRLASLFEPFSAGRGTSALQFEDSTSDESASVVSQTRAPKDPFRVSTELHDAPVQNTEIGTSNEPTNVILPSATLLPAQLIPPSPLSRNNTESTGEIRTEELPPHLPETDSTTSSEARIERTPLRVKPEVRRRLSEPDREQHQPLLTTTPLPFSLAHAATPDGSSPARKVSAEASATAEAPETVVVTIGRVDVRAVFAPPTPAPRSNRVQQQAMSLDEYLKQRSEGRR